MLSRLFVIEALFLLPPLGLAWFDGEPDIAQAFSRTLLLLLVTAGILFVTSRKAERDFYAREGFLLVALAWILISAFGALPLLWSGTIPSYLDAFFEAVSGFTTTGATIVHEVEALPRAINYWRCFMLWIGGMGVLVFLLAFLPASGGSGDNIHVLQAESPGPSIRKLVPKTRQHAAILYAIYLVLSLSCLLFLLLGGMPVFDSFCTTFATAGTGGFSIKADSLASYSPYLQGVICAFMALFGINFNLLYIVFLRRFAQAWADEELRAYVGIIVCATILIACNTAYLFPNILDAFGHAIFMVCSFISSTGYFTFNYDIWPEFARSLLMMLMLVGASAGSTGGGFKIARLVILAKSASSELKRMIHPRAVVLTRMNGQRISDQVQRGVHTYLFTYVAILFLSLLILSLDNFSLETNLTAAICSLSNMGSGLGMIGPAGTYTEFSALSKMVIIADMLLGRLEFFPLLLLFNTRSWNRSA